jgi:hypothetical protein
MTPMGPPDQVRGPLDFLRDLLLDPTRLWGPAQRFRIATSGPPKRPLYVKSGRSEGRVQAFAVVGSRL